jgi:hypothetical protein
VAATVGVVGRKGAQAELFHCSLDGVFVGRGVVELDPRDAVDGHGSVDDTVDRTELLSERVRARSVADPADAFHEMPVAAIDRGPAGSDSIRQPPDRDRAGRQVQAQRR